MGSISSSFIMKLKPTALGLALGVFWSVSILLLSLLSYQFGIWQEALSFLSSLYLYYSLTVSGVLFGMLIGFIDGFICGWIVGMLYNKFAE